VTEAFSIAAAPATAVQGRALIVLHLLPTGYNPVRDAVSDYRVGHSRPPPQATARRPPLGTIQGHQHTKKEKSDGNHHH
jgi:hypothetical protein